jgi:rubredoxin
MAVLFALVLMAVLAGLFYGIDPRRRAIERPLERPPLPPADALPGGDPLCPILVASPAVIERHAERWPCPVCQSAVRCEQHRAELLGGRRLRVAHVRCPRCGFARDLFFDLEPRAN